MNDLTSDNIKVDKKSQINISTYYIGYETSYGVKTLFIFNKIIGYIKDGDCHCNDRTKNITRVPDNKESRHMLKNIKKNIIKLIII